MNNPKYGFKPKGAQIADIYEIAKRLDSDDKQLIDKIVREFIDRSRKDIKKWRDSMKDIENPYHPNRSKYHDLVKDLSIDLHLQSQVQVRELATLCNRYRIMSGSGEENEELTKQIRKTWFRTLMKEWLHTRIDGTAVMQASVSGKEITGWSKIPKRNILPERQEITPRAQFYKGVPYRNNPEFVDHWIVELGECEDPGLMLSMAPNLIWKRNTEQAWADYGQLFGKPFRQATTRSSDKKTLDRIEYMLKMMGSAGYGVFPEGTTTELIADGARDAYQVWLAQANFHNSEISKAINGVTMLSDDGSSRSQSEVHFKINEKIVQSDMEGFESYVNDTLIPNHLIPIGYRFGKDDVFEFDMTESLGVKDHWEVVHGILQEYDVEPEWIEKTFGVPIIGKKQGSQPFNPAPGDPANPVQNYSLSDGQVFMPDYGVQCCGSDISNQESGEDYIRRLHAVSEEIFDRENKHAIPKGLYLERARELLNAFSTGFEDRLNVDWDSPDNYKIALYQANIFRFSAAGTWEDVKAMNQFYKDAENHNDFVNRVTKYTDVKRHHLQTEINACESIAQNGANYLRQVEDKEHYDLMYQTAGDGNVRASHRSLDGYVAPVDDAIWDRIYPPNAWNCRCEVIQVPAGSRTKSDRPIPGDAVQKGWDGNRGKLNTIFKANESYLKEFPEVSKFNRRTFGMERFTDTYKGKRNFEVRIKDQNEFVRELRAEADRFDGRSAYYKDYLGRHFEVSVDDFKGKFRYSEEENQERWSIFPLVKEVLSTPDEVWMSEQNRKNNKYSAVYLKAFKNKVLKVITNTEEEGKLKVTTWVANELKEDKINNDRVGIPVYSKK